MLKPLRDLVYILPLADREKVGSLYVPEQAKQRVDQGIIKYRGPKVEELRVGDHVLFSGWDGDQIVTEDDGLLYVMPESYVRGVFENDEPAYVFTREQLVEFIAAAKGDTTYVYNSSRVAVEYFADKLLSRINDHFFNALHF